MKKALGIRIKQERQKQNMSQQALCEGICSVSYLSKIETGQQEASMEIIALLLRNLDCEYCDDPQILTSFNHLNEAAWDAFYMEEYTFDGLSQLEDLSYQLIDSKRCIDALLSIALISLFKDNDLEASITQLDAYVPTMSDSQQYQTLLLKAHYQLSENPSALIQTPYHDTYGWFDLLKMTALFLEGYYSELILMSKQTYQTFAQHGNVLGMLSVSSLTGSAYSNLGDLDSLLIEYHRAKALNRFVKRATVEAELNYNLGSSYLVFGEYERAVTLLLSVLDVQEASQNLMSSTHQKLAFAYIFLEDSDRALYHVKKIQTQDPVTLKSLDLLQFMAANPDYIHNKQTIALMEACYEEAKNHNHFGVIQFYSYYLLEVYKKNYQYQKALRITDNFNYLRSSTYFNKKG